MLGNNPITLIQDLYKEDYFGIVILIRLSTDYCSRSKQQDIILTDRIIASQACAAYTLNQRKPNDYYDLLMEFFRNVDI